jgi:hypothetical protein
MEDSHVEHIDSPSPPYLPIKHRIINIQKIFILETPRE